MWKFNHNKFNLTEKVEGMKFLDTVVEIGMRIFLKTGLIWIDFEKYKGTRDQKKIPKQW